MAKFCGAIGYAEMQETSPGVYEEVLTEKKAHGDVLLCRRKTENGAAVNDGVAMGHRISLIASPHDRRNLYAIRYVLWMGVKWEIVTVEMEPPRMILTIGGVYHGKTDGTA